MDQQEIKSNTLGKVYDINRISVMAFLAMDQLRKSEKLCDVWIQADSSVFPAHKVVLAAQSPFFEAMFTGQFEESQESVIHLPSITATVMSIILDYLYTGSIELTESTVVAVMEASNFLQITPLIDSCCNILLENIDCGSCIGLYSLGKLISCAKLRDQSKCYILLNFYKVCQEAAFLELDAESVVDIITDDLLFAYEDSVFQAVMRWHHFKETERLLYLPELLSHVRLLFMSPGAFHKYIETIQSISNSLRSNPFVQQILENTRLLTTRFAKLPSSLLRKRNSFREAFLVFGLCLPDGHAVGHGKKLLNLAINGRVLNELNPPSKFDSLHVSDCRSQLFARQNDTILRYDSSVDDWQLIAPMNRTRILYGLCELNGFWYAVGGYLPGSNYEFELFNNVERYQPSNDVWIEVPPMPIAVMDPMVVGLQGKLYVFGGKTLNGIECDFVQRYDPQRNSWITHKMISFAGMPPEKHCGACALFQSIYLFYRIFPGVFDTDLIRVYDTTTHVWEEGPKFNHKYVCGPVVFDDKILIITRGSTDLSSSNSSNSAPLATVDYLECYSPFIRRWVDMFVISNMHAIYMHPSLRIEPSQKA